MHRRRPVSIVVAAGCFIIALALVAHGVYDGWPRYIATHHRPLPPGPRVITSTTTNPDETPVNPSQVGYSVAADMPKTLSLPTVGATGFIQQVGQDAVTRQLAVPTNIHFAGWYTGSVKPGDAGLSVIDGHISGRYDPGLFQNLANLRAGDKLSVEFGDGHSKEFAVVSVHTYALENAIAALFDRDPTIDSQLNLITCGGTYDAAIQTFNRRVVVVTKIVNS